jgi:hypothetical protein
MIIFAVLGVDGRELSEMYGGAPPQQQPLDAYRVTA